MEFVMTKNRQKYDESLKVFRAAARTYHAAVLKYRANEIGDNEFFAARRAYNDAQVAADVAEAQFIAAARSDDE
jgi:hypothetical protein